MLSSVTIVALCAVLAAGDYVEAPQSSWVFSAQSNLYAAPLIADMNPAPGLETIVSDSDVRTLRCIDARGNELWHYRGPWTKRLTASAALTRTTKLSGSGVVAVANGNGVVALLDAQSGAEVGHLQFPGAGSGNLSWADIDVDGDNELLVAGDDGVVRACRGDASVKWSSDSGGVPRLSGPISTCDIDGDKVSEIFSLTQWGAVSVSVGRGLRWRYEPTARFLGAPIVYRNGERTEVACVSRIPAQVHVLDADRGNLLWRAPLLSAPDDYSASGLAAGDLDGDGAAEVVVCDGAGHIHCFSNGVLQWVVETEKATNAMAVIGDVDGDAVPEVLAASGDRGLYCITADGKLLWRYAAGLRMLHPPSIADVDLDGKTDFLIGGGDCLLRCLSLGAPFHPEALPWPSRRGDASLTGARVTVADSGAATPIRKHHYRNAPQAREKQSGRPTIDEHANLLIDAGFERPLIRDGSIGDFDDTQQSKPLDALPNGWSLEGITGAYVCDTDVKRAGTASVRVDGGERGVTLISQAVRLDDVVDIRAGAFAKPGAGSHARIRWIGANGVIREDALSSGAEDADGWMALTRAKTKPPRGARYVQFVLQTTGGQSHWDDAQLVAHTRRVPVITVFANQVGYDIGAPKRFVVQSNFALVSARFALVSADGETRFEGVLPASTRIVGAFRSDWGYHYAGGDFSAFDERGTYKVRVQSGGHYAESFPFVIDKETLWQKTAEPAYRFFYYQRCGCEVPGYHGACHLDDAIGENFARYELWGGWHDAGDYNSYTNQPYVFELLQVYTTAMPRFAQWDQDKNGRADFYDEILWGGDHTRRMIAPDGSAFGSITSGYGFWGPPELETDNVPGTGDERPLRGGDTGRDPGYELASVAMLARLEPGNQQYVEAAERAYKWRAVRNVRDALQLSAALDLYSTTKNPVYATDARAIVDAVPAEQSEVLRRFDAQFGTDHREAIRGAGVARAEAQLVLAENPFGVYAFGTKEDVNYFGTPYDHTGWHVGNSSHALEAAAVAAEAYGYTHDDRFRVFVYDQLNWILGVNPYGLCLMEGEGVQNPPSYHHRYVSSHVARGAVPGSVVNGITWRAPGDDRPFFDMRGIDVPAFEPNEVWLPHNTNYLKALRNLYAVGE